MIGIGTGNNERKTRKGNSMKSERKNKLPTDFLKFLRDPMNKTELLEFLTEVFNTGAFYLEEKYILHLVKYANDIVHFCFNFFYYRRDNYLHG